MKYPISDHFDGRRFFNPGVDTDKTLRELWRFSLERRARSAERWPRRVEAAPTAFSPLPRHIDDIALTYIGHSTFFLQLGGINILTDPIFSQRASPIRWAGPRRVRDSPVSLEELPDIDLVLLSHNHYDHMDLPTLRRISRRWPVTIVTGLGNGAYLQRRRIGRAVELDWWQSWTMNENLRVTYVPAQHWSSRTMIDKRKMLWGGHVVETKSARIYFAGDTGYPGHFTEIAARCGSPDISLLPIGAYEPRWFTSAQHINPDEAVRAHRELGSALSIAMHFGTFRLTKEEIDAPAQALDDALRQHGVPLSEFILPKFGETMRWSEKMRADERAGR